MDIQRGQTHYPIPNEVELMKYTINWTQPYSLDYVLQPLYNQNDSIIEQLLKTSEMLDAKAVIDRIKQL